jgi:hypothetical protein
MTRQLDFRREYAVLGAALDSFNELESRMEDLICAYILPRPDRVAFIRDQVLHNSSISFGSKIRIVLSISKAVGGPRLSRDKFHRALSIRNALAHGDSARHVKVNLNALRPEPYGPYLVVRSIKGDGEITEQPKGAAVTELMGILEELREQIDKLIKRVPLS